MTRSLYFLALLAFMVGTAELVVAGVLVEIAVDLDVGTGHAGLLVSAYALVYAISAPVLIYLTAAVERRRLLLLATLVFCVGNLLAALSPSFTVLMLARAILASSTALIIVLVIGFAIALASEQARGRAISLVFAGIVASLVAGVPLGTLIGAEWGWRRVFEGLAVLSLLMAVLLVRVLPRLPGVAAVPWRRQLAALAQRKVVFAQCASLLQMTGQFTVYTYIVVFLVHSMGLSAATISLVLLVYGLGGVLGALLGGWAADRFGSVRAFSWGLLLHALALWCLPLSTVSLASLLVLVAVWCVFNMVPGPAIQKHLTELAPATADIQIGLNTSAIQIGVALGASIGALLIERWPIESIAYVGGALVLLGLLAGRGARVRPPA